MAVFPGVLSASPFQLGPFDAFLGALCFIIIASLVAFILVAVWVYRDAESRGMSGALWVVLLIIASLFFAFIGGLVVLIIYLIVRSEHPVGGYYAAAPYPGYAPPYPPPAYPPAPATPPPGAPSTPPVATAATSCPKCGARLNPGATFCGNCGTRL